jgi:hypothetical protein
MPIDTIVDMETGARTHVVTGELTPEVLVAALGEIYQRRDYSPAACSLWDLRGAEIREFSKTEIREVADFVSQNRNAPPGTCAALVVSRSLDYGLARMYEQMLVASSDVRVMVFMDIDEARAWLEGDAED